MISLLTSADIRVHRNFHVCSKWRFHREIKNSFFFKLPRNGRSKRLWGTYKLLDNLQYISLCKHKSFPLLCTRSHSCSAACFPLCCFACRFRTPIIFTSNELSPVYTASSRSDPNADLTKGKGLLSVTEIIRQIPLKPVALIPWWSAFSNQILESCYCKSSWTVESKKWVVVKLTNWTNHRDW